MQSKVNDKHILTCLLLSVLLLIGYISVPNANIAHANIDIEHFYFAVSNTPDSSMDGTADTSSHDSMTAPDDPTALSIGSTGQARWLGPKNNNNIITAMLAFQLLCLTYGSSFIKAVPIPTFSNILTIFLHKKDGMK